MKEEEEESRNESKREEKNEVREQLFMQKEKSLFLRLNCVA